MSKDKIIAKMPDGPPPEPCLEVSIKYYPLRGALELNTTIENVAMLWSILEMAKASSLATEYKKKEESVITPVTFIR